MVRKGFFLCTVLWMTAVQVSCSVSEADNGKEAVFLDPAPKINMDIKLRVEGISIINGAGNPVQLRGIYTRGQWLDSEQEVQWFKEWGINYVRLLLVSDEDYWQVVNEGKVDLRKRCQLREENLARMDEICGWFERNEIYYIMEVPWRWYGIEQEFPEPELLKMQMTRMYSQLAQRYKHLDYLVGYCMFSEIYVAPEYYKIYKELCTDIVDAVRKIDPERILSVTGVQVSGVEWLLDQTRVERPNLIYDFHYYWVKSFTHYRPYYGDMRYPGRVPHGYSCRSFNQDREFHESMIDHGLAFSRRWNVPIWCGEYGAFNNAPDGSTERWIRDVTQILEKHEIPWILWRWNPESKTIPEYWKELWQGQPDRWVTINPHGGSFTEPATVKLETWQNPADIRYTLNGSEPDENSKIYTTPFQISKNTMVKTKLIDNLFPQTPVDTAVFTFEARPAEHPEGKLKQGLNYIFYDQATKRIEESLFSDFEVIERGIEKMLKGCPKGKSIFYKGYLKIPEDGRYFFYPESFGACEIYIGNKKVNKHEATKYEWNRINTGIIVLKAGLHEFRAYYSRPPQTEGGFTLKIEKSKEPFGKPRLVTREMLWHVHDE